jgi:flagellar motor switch protein FliG
MKVATNLQRAAILVKNLPKEQASKLIARLDAADLQPLFREIRHLHEQTSAALPQIINDFNRAAQALQQKADVGRGAFSDTIEGGPFEFLSETGDALRYQLLSGEHPKNIATVLAFLPPKHAVEILNLLEPSFRVSVLRRLCNSDRFVDEDVANLAFSLKSRLRKIENLQRAPRAGVQIASRLLSCTDSETREAVLQVLDQQDSEIAAQVKNSIFQFRDLVNLSSADIKSILNRVDTSLWAPALKIERPEVQHKVLENMAPGPRTMLKQEIAAIGPVDYQRAFRAQLTIVQTILNSLPESVSGQTAGPTTPATTHGSPGAPKKIIVRHR